MESSILI